jgi:hypothetical protein
MDAERNADVAPSSHFLRQFARRDAPGESIASHAEYGFFGARPADPPATVQACMKGCGSHGACRSWADRALFRRIGPLEQRSRCYRLGIRYRPTCYRPATAGSSPGVDCGAYNPRPQSANFAPRARLAGLDADLRGNSPDGHSWARTSDLDPTENRPAQCGPFSCLGFRYRSPGDLRWPHGEPSECLYRDGESRPPGFRYRLGDALSSCGETDDQPPRPAQ